MTKTLLTALALFTVGCATTYNLPQEERSRAFRTDEQVVWDASLAALEDLEIAIVQAEREHGQIMGRTKGSIWDLKGHVVRVVITDTGNGRVRLEANAETVSDDRIVDFGRAHGIVRDFLEAMDERLSQARVGS